jgi:murein DD-endopeptidase MepM/ murein hydrolase activator NlpD
MPPRNLPLSPALLIGLASIVVLVGFSWPGSDDDGYISPWSGASVAAVPQSVAGVVNPFSGEAQMQGQGARFGDADKPHGNPLRSAATMMTQGYGVGTHAPAATWGAIDLAIDGDGDGRAGSMADVSASQGAPIYATHRGVVTLTPGSYPAGNHIWVGNDNYKTGFSHLDRFAEGLASGQTVERGTLIGYLGNSGMSSGPHLDYQVWVNEGGRWVNRDPHEFAPFE